MSFLTLEDVNSSLIKYAPINIFHKINTKDIDIDEFSNVKYDFCDITHIINGNEHTFKFTIVNSNWTGAYYFTDENGNYLDYSASYDSNTGVLSFTTSLSSVILVLYCTNLANSFDFVRLTWRPLILNPIITSSIEENNVDIPVISLNNEDLDGESYIIKYHDKFTDILSNETRDFNLNDDNEFIISQFANPNFDMYSINYNGATFYYGVFIKKVSPIIEINDELLVGKINRVKLTVPQDFISLNSFIPDSEFPYLKGNVYYGRKTIPIEFDNGEYYFNLDLREKTNNNHVKLSLKILETDYVQGNVYNFNIPSKYVSIDNISDLIYELGINGSKIIELSRDLNLVGNLIISHDILIYGKEHSLNLNQFSIIINEGIKLKANNLSFINGDTAIIQNINSSLDLTNCRFNNCISSNYNNIGSCIFCDVDLESLSIDDDFTTNLSKCTFIDNHSAILHGGQLSVDYCKFRNENVNLVDMNNPSFIYQVDGDATITNSIFDINYSSDDLCENNLNIGFSQALVMCGETATINRANHISLQSDNTLPFVESPYNNKAHLFVKYYYPSIDSCVFSSPMENYEDKSFCHCVSGIDWVFKNNVQITKVSWKSENKLNKIDWED